MVEISNMFKDNSNSKQPTRMSAPHQRMTFKRVLIRSITVSEEIYWMGGTIDVLYNWMGRVICSNIHCSRVNQFHNTTVFQFE